MPDLTELLRLAEGARADGDWFPSDFGHGYISRQDAAFMSAMSPDTAKKLIAVALAAQAVLKETPDQWGAIPKLRKALRDLAGSPQERRE